MKRYPSSGISRERLDTIRAICVLYVRNRSALSQKAVKALSGAMSAIPAEYRSAVMLCVSSDITLENAAAECYTSSRTLSRWISVFYERLAKLS